MWEWLSRFLGLLRGRFIGKFEILNRASNTTIVLDGESGGIIAGGGTSRTNGKIVLWDNKGLEWNWIMGENGEALFYGDLWVGPVLARDPLLRTFRFVGSTGDFEIIRRYPDGLRRVMWFNSDLAQLHIGCDLPYTTGELYVGVAYIGGSATRPGASGVVSVRNRNGIEMVRLSAFDDGNIYLLDNLGNRRIHLDGKMGDIKLEGADCSEEFDVVEMDNIDPGSILVISQEGKLELCKEPYDKKVVGVVSGGNGSNPGIILDKKNTQDKRLPIALNGKVYCKADAQYSPIEVGDLLTTSATPGHAMKADDSRRAFGAVIGKALSPLEEGRGLIQILVALQ